ncbi:GntR family transcriptional regulator [Granulosicoccus sp. 3-233]|uniref:GntR family transcriptional regulator n=1 Tax=Granulosicoccus sp. 3-233 TaxID=3417969 RepID=UPI003D3330D7
MPVLSSIEDLLDGVELQPGQGLVAQIYDVLWQLIVSIRLLPGQLITEKEIAEALKASKTPVREALIRLEETGLVSVVPKSGTYVTPIRINTYIEACFIRLQLEIGAVRRAATYNANGRALEQLDEIIEQQSEALSREDFANFFLLDEALHRAFFEMAGVTGAWAVVKRTQSEIHRIRQLKHRFRISRRSVVLRDHKAIVEAIRCGDSDEAQYALVRHIGSLEGELQELAALPELLAFMETSGFTRPGTRTTRT